MEKGVVEKCLQKISDPFTLVVLASYRSQELASGMNACIPTEGSKDALVALKEISSGKLDIPALEDRMVHSLQKFAFLSEEGLNDSIESAITMKNTDRLEKPSFQAEALFHTVQPASPTLSVVENQNMDHNDDEDEDHDSSDQELLWDSDDSTEGDDLSDDNHDEESPQEDDSSNDDEGL